jgi:hypothetical protein
MELEGLFPCAKETASGLFGEPDDCHALPL